MSPPEARVAADYPPRPLSRLAVTRGHLWMSTARAAGPVDRLDRAQLRDGRRLQLVDELAPPLPPDESEVQSEGRLTAPPEVN